MTAYMAGNHFFASTFHVVFACNVIAHLVHTSGGEVANFASVLRLCVLLVHVLPKVDPVVGDKKAGWTLHRRGRSTSGNRFGILVLENSSRPLGIGSQSWGEVVFIDKVLVKHAAFLTESTRGTVANNLIFNPIFVRKKCCVLLHYVLYKSIFGANSNSTSVARIRRLDVFVNVKAHQRARVSLVFTVLALKLFVGISLSSLCGK